MSTAFLDLFTRGAGRQLALVVPCATCEPVRVMEPYAPPALSVILVMKRLSWDRIIAGEKIVLLIAASKQV